MRWALACLAALLANPAQAACKLALVLALDISSSVNAHEYDIQLQGLVRAFSTPEVHEVILTPEGSGIAVSAFEWSGVDQQTLIADWTYLASSADIDAFAARLSRHQRSAADQPTAIGRAVKYGAERFASAPACWRKVIDISGDGHSNVGVDPSYFRERGLLDGITINGLVIQGAFPDPGIYYRGQVMQGPNAFVALARDFDDYPSVIIGKLIREIGEAFVVGER